MDKDDQEWIEGNLSEVVEKPSADFDIELWLSTDGKHSVKVSPKNPESRKAAFMYAQELYDRVLLRYGSKQAHATKEYKEAEGGLGKCKDCGAPNLLSSKGKPYCSDKCWLRK